MKYCHDPLFPPPSVTQWNPLTVLAMTRLRISVMGVRLPSRSTMMSTGLPDSPCRSSTHLSVVSPNVEGPAMSTIRSLAMIPAANAGESSSGVTTVNQPSLASTWTPIPTKSPVSSLENSLVSAGGT